MSTQTAAPQPPAASTLTPAAAAQFARPTRICFVCMGNICRSPSAEVVLRALVEQQGRAEEFVIASAGTGGWHVGAEMDPRSRATLSAAGYLPSSHVARQFVSADFGSYDLVLALDGSHVDVLQMLAVQAADPARATASIRLLRSYDPHAVASGDLEVADPYNGGPGGFARVLAEIERGCAGVLASVPARA